MKCESLFSWSQILDNIKKQRQELMPQQKINKTITSYIFTSNTDVDALIPPSPLPPGFCENVQDWEV